MKRLILRVLQKWLAFGADLQALAGCLSCLCSTGSTWRAMLSEFVSSLVLILSGWVSAWSLYDLCFLDRMLPCLFVTGSRRVVVSAYIYFFCRGTFFCRSHLVLVSDCLSVALCFCLRSSNSITYNTNLHIMIMIMIMILWAYQSFCLLAFLFECLSVWLS